MYFYRIIDIPVCDPCNPPCICTNEKIVLSCVLTILVSVSDVTVDVRCAMTILLSVSDVTVDVRCVMTILMSDSDETL